ncbi:hypothetical protein [Aliarcobacter thereius]|uniref:hypothetical protein n=1 Tax=Aliarcobacter thereius TaxID=544718 RepID=UPI0008271402|nr:hypothetical protein [Aliarcobacter thereius]OCL90583.1 hypothetical protein AAX25_01681 [Aliarcobacter thereius]
MFEQIFELKEIGNVFIWVLILVFFWLAIYKECFSEISKDNYEEVHKIYKNTKSEKLKKRIEDAFKGNKINKFSYGRICYLNEKIKYKESFIEAKEKLQNDCNKKEIK